LGFIGLSLANDYRRERRLTPLLASGVYLAAAASSLFLFSWWPLITGIVLAWFLEQLETRSRNRNGADG